MIHQAECVVFTVLLISLDHGCKLSIYLPHPLINLCDLQLIKLLNRTLSTGPVIYQAKRVVFTGLLISLDQVWRLHPGSREISNPNPDLSIWPKWSSCFSPQLRPWPYIGIRSECHAQNANLWNATDLCVWGLGVRVLGLGRAFVVLGFWAMAFCHWRFVPRPHI